MQAMLLAAAFTLLSTAADASDWTALDRSPVDLVVSPENRWLVTANQTSDSISLVDCASGKVLDEIRVARRPAALALHPSGNSVVVSCSDGEELDVVDVREGKLHLRRTIPLRGEPHGVAVTTDGRTAYVALTSLDQVAVVDLEAGQPLEYIRVGRWPRFLTLSPDGSRLAVGTSGDRGVSVVDTQSRELLYIEQFVGLNIGHLQSSRDGRHVYFPWMVYRRNPIDKSNIRLGWVLASRVARVRLDGPARREALSLDPPGKAIADPHGLALTSDDQRLVVSASGSQELLVYRLPDLPLQDHGGTDHIPPELLQGSDRFFRIDLGGRPMGVRIGRDDQTCYVANYLHNSVQVVDLVARKLVRTIPLGGPSAPSLARQGAAIFYDGKRSLDQWYSCHSCHYEGGTNAVVMDTMNDGSRFTFKTVPALYHIDQTAPWTWHGWQTDLRAAMHHSLTTTMLGPEPSQHDAEAMVAFLQSLEPPPNPHVAAHGRLNEAAERGKVLFHSASVGCSGCHAGTYFTDGQVHDVGSGRRNDRYEGFNTPSLQGVFRKTLWLHDGRARSLDELLSGPHEPAQVAGSRSLSESERRDLVEYLKTL